jgi:hypothetical protein
LFCLPLRDARQPCLFVGDRQPCPP